MSIPLPVRSPGGGPRPRAAQIPDASSVPQARTAGDPGVQVPAGAFDSGGAALAKAGADLSTTAERYNNRVQHEAEKQQADLDYAQVGERTLALKETYGKAFEDAQSVDFSDTATWQQHSAEADKARDQTLSDIGQSGMSPRAQERLKLTAGELALSQKTAYGKLHLAATEAKTIDVATRETYGAAAEARANPYDADGILARRREELVPLQATLNADKLRAITTASDSAILTSSINGMLDKNDFRGAKARLADEKYFEMLTPAVRDSLTSQVDVAQRTAGAEVKGQFRDHIASIETTGVGIPGYLAKAEAAGVTGVQLDVMKREQTSAAHFYQATQAIGGQTPEAMVATVNGLKPTPGSVGFADGQNRYEQAQRAVAVELQRRKEDPAAAVAGDPRVQQAAQAASKDPAATATYANTVLAAQEARGIPATDRTVLTKDQASHVVATSFAGNPEKWADTIDGMRNQYGDAWPTVWRDLTKAKMPVEAQIFGTLSTKVTDSHGSREVVLPGDAVVRKDFGAALQTTRKTLEANLVTGDKGKIDAAVADGMSDWSQAEMARGGAAGNVQAMRSAGEMLAYQYRSKGMDPEAAGKKAADDLVNGRHDLVNSDNFNLYVHKGQGAAVEFTGRKILGALDPQNIPDPGGDPSLSAEQRKAAYAESVKQGGTWVLSSKGDKAILLDPAGTPVTKFGPDNFQAAVADLKLNQQEQNLYQTHLANLKKGGVRNPDGSTSTLFDVTVDVGDRTVVIPTVWNGRILPPKLAVKEAAKKGWDFWPSYKTADEADARYGAIHDYMERDLIATPVQFSIDDAKLDDPRLPANSPGAVRKRTIQGSDPISGGSGDDTLGGGAGDDTIQEKIPYNLTKEMWDRASPEWKKGVLKQEEQGKRIKKALENLKALNEENMGRIGNIRGMAQEDIEYLNGIKKGLDEYEKHLDQREKDQNDPLNRPAPSNLPMS